LLKSLYPTDHILKVLNIKGIGSQDGFQKFV
jgi:hypothetical protein